MGHPILTDEDGKPIPRPSREDFKSDAEFATAFYAFKDRVSDVANRGFVSGLKQGLKKKGE